MARPLPKELREKIVSTYVRGLGTIEEVALIYEIHPRTVAKYLQIQRDLGDLTPKPVSGRPPILDDANLKIIKEIILSKNDRTLQDYCEIFKEKTGIEITIVSMHNACKKLNFRRKKRVTMLKKENEWIYSEAEQIT